MRSSPPRRCVRSLRTSCRCPGPRDRPSSRSCIGEKAAAPPALSRSMPGSSPSGAGRAVASLCRCKFARGSVPGVSLCGGRLLGERVVGFVISDAVESLAVELGEADAVGLVSDEEIQNGPDEREAALLAGEAAHDLRPPFHFAE